METYLKHGFYFPKFTIWIRITFWGSSFFHKLKLEGVYYLLLFNSSNPLSPFMLNKRFWSLKWFGYFTCKSFFLFSYSVSRFFFFLFFTLVDHIWKAKVPSKVEDFVWLVVHDKVNANNLLLVRSPSKSFLLIFAICGEQWESI